MENFKFLLASLILIGIYFLQFPLSGSLFGEMDAVADLAIFEQLNLQIQGILFGTYHGSVNYPGPEFWITYGVDFGGGIIFLIYKWLGIPVIWSCWLFISTIFALNSFGFAHLLQTLKINRNIAWLGGLLFSLSHFFLANLENVNALIFFFFLFAVSFTIKGMLHQGTKYFYWAALFASIQIYFTPYNFILTVILIPLYILIRFRVKEILGNNFKSLFLCTLMVILIISPFIYLYILSNQVTSLLNIISEKDLYRFFSLNLDDFFRVLPGHLYLNFIDLYHDLWISKMKSAYLGVTIWIVALYSIFKLKGRKELPILLIILGIVISLGPVVSYRSKELFPNVTYPFYYNLGWGSFFRIPLRAFSLTVMGLSILFSMAMHHSYVSSGNINS